MKYRIEIECDKKETVLAIIQAIRFLQDDNGKPNASLVPIAVRGVEMSGVLQKVKIHGVKDASPGDPTPEPTARTTV